jgi:hypothetical protein
MSLAADDDFGFSDAGLDPVADGTSILLTGSDVDALESVFYQLVAGRGDEHSVVLATDRSGRDVTRGLDGVERGAGDRARVLAAEGRDGHDGVTAVSDLTDLTGLGMQLSTEVAETAAAGGRTRAGILLCSSILDAADDTTSVYRFLNSNFLNHVRREDAIGVRAVDTSVDFGSGASSTVKGMETSFSGRVHVEDASAGEATVTVSGLGDADGTRSVTL